MAKPYLCIDFYRTLSFDHLWHTAPKDLSNQIEKLLFKNTLTGSLVDSWMRGSISSEGVHLFVAEKLDVSYKYIFELFIESAQTLDCNVEALELITQLRDTYSAVLVTDNMDSFSRFTVSALKLDAVFDQIINSANVGKLKADIEQDLFMTVTDDFSQSILIDDSVPNCKRFRQKSGVAYLVTEQNTAVAHLKRLTVTSKP